MSGLPRIWLSLPACRAITVRPPLPLCKQVYVLADTTYNSLSVDEVAATHVDADCVVHYGRASLTKLSRIPAFFVFPEAALDVGAAAAALASCTTLRQAADKGRPIMVFLDQPQLGAASTLAAALVAAAPAVTWVLADVPTRTMEPEGVAALGGGCVSMACCSQQTQRPMQQHVQQQDCCDDASGMQRHPAQQQQTPPKAGTSGSIAGYHWRLPPPASSPHDAALVWVGAPDAPALLQLQLTYSSQPWATWDPAAGALVEGLPLDVSRALRRRYFLVQKARDARIVGILVGTLGVAGYRDAIDALREAALVAGKKAYTLLVGKPSPAKLANFPEIEVFVMVADPQGQARRGAKVCARVQILAGRCCCGVGGMAGASWLLPCQLLWLAVPHQVLDCKEYMAPIITPHEAMLAFDTGAEEPAWDEAAYCLDFDDLVQTFRQRQAGGQKGSGGGSGTTKSGRSVPRFSLVDAAHHGDEASSADEAEGARIEAVSARASDRGASASALALQAQAALTLTQAPAGRSDLVVPASAADYLVHKRSWKGVEAPLVGAEPKTAAKAVPGLSGRAAGFVGEGQPEGGSGSGSGDTM